VLQGLASLRRKYSYQSIEKACELAVSHGAYRLRDLRRLISEPTRQNTFEFLEEHPLIRDISDYGTFIRRLEPGKRHKTRKEVVPV
jgi:hypothetical protein